MNIAITIWENRISPVFDAAENLLIAELRDGEIVARKNLSVPSGPYSRLIQLFREHRVKVLICGALCVGPAALLEAHGVHVVSFIAGDAEQVLSRFALGEDLSSFFMPGCRWRRCRAGTGGGSPRERLKIISLTLEVESCQALTEPVRQDADR